MITFSKFGHHGRLANQLFQYATMLGLAEKLRTKLVLPSWQYAEYFESKFPEGNLNGVTKIMPVHETKFSHDALLFDRVREVTDNNFTPDLFGYFQSEKYWSHCRPLVRNTLTFQKGFIDQLKRKYWKSFSDNKKVIAIHIRRGDYVGNSNYVQLPITYFISALFMHFPDWRKYNIIVFGDEIGYCKVHFDCLDNVAFAEGNSAIEDLALGSMCHHFILSNSSYSWWMAYLGQKNGSKVVRPADYFAGELLKKCPTLKDFYPEGWISHRAQQLDLSDVTFTIPVAFDHKDRKKNLDLCVCLLQHNFITNIIVGEQGGNSFQYMERHAGYINFTRMTEFHRTKMLNIMAREAQTPYVANWDADVIVPPLQLYEAVHKLRKGAAMVYPYERSFARVPRLPWFEKLERAIDIGVVGDTKFNGMNNNDAISFGGAVLFNRHQFFKGGAENEHFISFGPEDAERFHRFTTLGFNVKRTLGTLYHINHYVGPNSSNRHHHVKRNRSEWDTILSMGKPELAEYVNRWPWAKEVIHADKN